MVEIKLKNSDNSWGSIPELKGNNGNVGVTPSITLNTISGSKANVTQSGTPENLHVNLTVPNGVSGTIPNESSLAKKSGNLGSLGGYNTPFVTTNALTINQNSNDNNQVTGAVTITVSNGTSNTEWVKSVMITNPSASVSLGSKWKWSGGEVPTITENSLLVLHWCNDTGVANLVEGGVLLRVYTGTVTNNGDGADIWRKDDNGEMVLIGEIASGATGTFSLAVDDRFRSSTGAPWLSFDVDESNGISVDEWGGVISVSDGFSLTINPIDNGDAAG